MYILMYISNMPRTYSVAEARRNLPSIVRDASEGRAVAITRRGVAVAVVVSPQDYRRLDSTRPSFRDAYAAWRARTGQVDLGVGPDYFDGLRDRSPGRRVRL